MIPCTPIHVNCLSRDPREALTTLPNQQAPTCAVCHVDQLRPTAGVVARPLVLHIPGAGHHSKVRLVVLMQVEAEHVRALHSCLCTVFCCCVACVAPQLLAGYGLLQHIHGCCAVQILQACAFPRIFLSHDSSSTCKMTGAFVASEFAPLFGGTPRASSILSPSSFPQTLPSLTLPHCRPPPASAVVECT